MSAIVISSAAPSTTDIYTLSLHDALPILQDLFDENILRQKVEGALVQKNQLLVKVYNRRAVEVDEIVDELLSYADRLQPMVTDTSLVLNQALDEIGRTHV